jgi:hypothetical protein
MPDTKLSALTALAVAPDTDDEIYIRDISEAAADESKRILISTLFTSPTLVTPALGTPSSGTLTNATGLPVAGIVNGTARQLIQTNAGATAAEWASNIDIPGTLDVTGATVLDSTLTIASELIQSAGLLAFQKAYSLSTTTGNLTLLPSATAAIFRQSTATGSDTLTQSSFNLAPTATQTGIAIGMQSIIQVVLANAQNFATIRALDFLSRHRGSGLVSNYHGVEGTVRIESSGSLTNGRSFVGSVTELAGSTGTITNSVVFDGYNTHTNLASGQTITNAIGCRSTITGPPTGATITNAYHFYAVNASSVVGTLSTQYGMYIENLTGGSNNYGIYVVGAGTLALWIDSGTSRFDGAITSNNGAQTICSSTGNLASANGASAGPFTTITSITVVNGIVTALSGS